MTHEQAMHALTTLSAQTMDKWGLHLTAAVVPAAAEDAQAYYNEVFKNGAIEPDCGLTYSKDGAFSLAWINIGYTRAYYLPIDGDLPFPIEKL